MFRVGKLCPSARECCGILRTSSHRQRWGLGADAKPACQEIHARTNSSARWLGCRVNTAISQRLCNALAAEIPSEVGKLAGSGAVFQCLRSRCVCVVGGLQVREEVTVCAAIRDAILKLRVRIQATGTGRKSSEPALLVSDRRWKKLITFALLASWV